MLVTQSRLPVIQPKPLLVPVMICLAKCVQKGVLFSKDCITPVNGFLHHSGVLSEDTSAMFKDMIGGSDRRKVHACAAGLLAAHDDLAEAEQERRLAAATPKLPAEWRRQIAAQTGSQGQLPSSFGKIVRCSQFHGPRVVVIGDASHSVTSTLGQVFVSSFGHNQI